MSASIVRLETPVLLITYRRPELTQRVLDRIRQVEPRVLFVAADGPRTKEDEETVRATRQLFERLDWKCEIRRIYADRNLGLPLRTITAIDAAFEECEELIMLEDDTLPELSFFQFCQELLVRYRDDERVMQVIGTCLVDEDAANPASPSYVFTQLARPWGAALWKRAWTGFDASFFASWRARALRSHRLPAILYRPWGRSIDRDPQLRARIRDCGDTFARWMRACARREIVNSWSGAWALHVVRENGLVASPRRNLVRNIGFGPGATHTRAREHASAERDTRAMIFPLRHPSQIEVDRDFQRRSARAFDAAWRRGPFDPS